MPTGPNYRPNIQLPNLMGHTGNPYDLNLYPQDMIFEKPAGWDDTKGVIDTSNPQVMHAGFNFGNNQNTNNQGLGWWMNNDRSRYPSPMMPGNLSQDLGAATYRGPQLNTLDPTWQNILRQQSMEEPSAVGEGYDQRRFTDVIADKFKGFTTPVMSVLKGLGDKFQRPEAKQKAYEAIMGDRKGLGLWDTQRGTYGGTGYDLRQTPSGLKVYSEVNPFGKNFDSAFGSQSLEEMDEKTLAWAMDRLSKGKKISTRLRNILSNRGRLNVTGVDRVGQDQPVDTGRTTPTRGGGFNPTFDRPTPHQDRPSWHGATEARGQTFRDTGGQQGRVAGPGFGQGAYWAKGGRVGLYAGGDPDEPTEDIFEVMQDQGIPFGEQVEGEGDILGQLVAKYIEAGFPPDQAEEMAMQEFQQMAMGAEQDQGLASLV